MKDNFVRRVLILGSIAISGIVLVQAYWLLKTYDLKDKEFDQSVRIALRNVANALAEFNQTDLPKKDLINRQSSNYYAVNFNSYIDANVLENYLYQELTDMHINTDFEYAVFDCFDKDLIYGNYCKLEDKGIEIKSDLGAISEDLDYYFVVKFPSRQSFLLGNMFTTVIFFLIAIISVLFFTYSLLVIMKQRRLSGLQRDFINNMTHEFKTPISSIKIAADVLSKHSDEVSNPRIKRYADIIVTQNERLNNQVEKVLNIAKLENNTFKVNREYINLSELVDDIIKSESIKMNDGNITYLSPPDDIEVNADKLHLSNVVYNLIDNAIKYSDKDPDIEVELSISLGATKLSVKDQGIGIKKEDQKAIFEKFYRVSTGNLHNVKGFGLGLFYVMSISKAHGWAVDVDSALGDGTTITINIPTNTKLNDHKS